MTRSQLLVVFYFTDFYPDLFQMFLVAPDNAKDLFESSVASLHSPGITAPYDASPWVGLFGFPTSWKLIPTVVEAHPWEWYSTRISLQGSHFFPQIAPLVLHSLLSPITLPRDHLTYRVNTNRCLPIPFLVGVFSVFQLFQILLTIIAQMSTLVSFEPCRRFIKSSTKTVTFLYSQFEQC